MVDERKVFGYEAESFVESYLQKKQYRILERQFRTRDGEIDLIALDGDEVVFIEVKARRSGEYGDPEDAVGRAKILHIEAVGETFLEQSGRADASWRIDVVAVRYGYGEPLLDHLVDVDVSGVS